MALSLLISSPSLPFPKLDPLVPRPRCEQPIFDVVVLSLGDDSWAKTFEEAGLRVFRPLTDGLDGGTPRALTASLVQELANFACRRVVKEWHCSDLWAAFAPLRRLRETGQSTDELQRGRVFARRVGLLFTVAVRCNQWVSIEKPARSKVFQMNCFATLARLGCVLTSFTHCGFGSPFLRATDVLRNKPWLCVLQRSCGGLALECSRNRLRPPSATFVHRAATVSLDDSRRLAATAASSPISLLG